jgi:hypothetical protein
VATVPASRIVNTLVKEALKLAEEIDDASTPAASS